jgi:hypothetical protein
MKGAYVCTKCTIEYWPNQQPVKKSSKFDLPGGPTDEHGNVIGDNNIPIAVIDDVNKELSSTTFKKQITFHYLYAQDSRYLASDICLAHYSMEMNLKVLWN